MPSSISCDVILDFEGMKYCMLELLFVRPRYGLSLSRDANFIKIIFYCDVTNDLYDTHSELVTNCTKFGTSRSVSFGGVKPQTHPYRKNLATKHRFFQC